MKYNFATRIIPFVVAIIAALLLYSWLRDDATSEVDVRVPVRHLESAGGLEDSQPSKIVGNLVTFDGKPSYLPGNWARFRGPNFDAVAKDDFNLAKTWPDEGPEILWSIDLGEGYAGTAILNGRVYIIDYDTEKKADAIRCFSLDDGREIWRYWYPIKVKRNHGMSRTVPAVTDKYIVTIGPKCHVTCLDSTTGKFLWMINLVKDFHTIVPPWYAGQCPLIDDGKAIIAPGGDALMIAVDCSTGKIVWQSPNPRGWQMTHSSIIPMEFMQKRFYIYCGSGGVAGISPDNGEILWDTTQWKIRIANVPTPLVIDNNHIFLSGGYNSGSMMLALTGDGNTINAEPAFRLTPEVFGSAQQTPIFYDGYIYGVRPDGQLTCLDTDGLMVWASTSAHRFGLGPYIIANGLIYVMDDHGLLTMAQATPAGYKQLAQAKVLDGPDSWGPMAIASGRLILRDLNRMICLDISE